LFNSCSLLGSDCFRAGLTGADTHDFFQVSDEHFAVADLAGTGGVDDGLNDLLSDVIGDSQLAVMPCTPISATAWRTSSSLKGLMMAVISFMFLLSLCGFRLL